VKSKQLRIRSGARGRRRRRRRSGSEKQDGGWS
jgi:hypothetical protein